jgi:hypothetical protein
MKQGSSQTVTGVTVVTGAQAQGGPGGAPRGSWGGPGRIPRGPQEGSQTESAVKAKVGAVCFLEKGRK